MNDGTMKVLIVVVMVATLGFMAWGVMHHIEDDHREEWRHQQQMNQSRYHHLEDQRTWSEKWSDWWNNREYDPYQDRYRNDPYRHRNDPYRYRNEEDYWRRRYDPYYQNGCVR